METVEIAMASDGNYFPGLLTTAVSMATSASKDASLRFHVLDGGISAADWEFLERKIASAHPHAAVGRIPVDERLFAGYPSWNGPGRMAYARLLLPELLPQCAFVVYSDIDVFWTADVVELWNLRTPDFSIQAGLDASRMVVASERRWFAERSIPFDPSRYVCSGVMILNLGRLRRDGGMKKVRDFLSAHPDVSYADQTAINAFQETVGILPRKWQRFSYELRSNELPGAWAIHFAGDAPWKHHWWTQTLNPSWPLWHRFYGSMYGLTARQSLLKVYSRREIAVRRLAYFLVSTPGVRHVFFLFLRLTGRGGYVPWLREKGGLE